MKPYQLFVKWFLRRCYWYVRARGRTLLRGTPPDSRVEGTAPLLPTSFQEYIQLNAAFWSGITAKGTTEKGECILVEGLLDHAGYLMPQALIARAIMYESNMHAVALLRSPSDLMARRLFESYGITDFHFVSNGKNNWCNAVRNEVTAARLLRRVKSGTDLLQVEFEGVDLGRLVYDTFTRQTGEGTIEVISQPIFDLMVEALKYYQYCRELFAHHRFRVVVQAETNYVTWGVLARVGLKHGAIIYSRLGTPARIIVRRYDDLSQISTHQYRPTQAEFNFVYEHYRRQAVEAAEASMQGRFGGEAVFEKEPDAALAFAQDRPVLSKEDLCKRYGWSGDKPIVCVMSPVFNDATHSIGVLLFPDYLVWLRETLRAIRQIDHVNWLVKSHPMEEYFNCKQTVESEFQALFAHCAHVRLLPRNINTATLLNVADTIVTVCGTEGIEFSCYGIPCILAGEAFYSGFGFTVEPKSQEEYFALLKNIHKLSRLNSAQVERAKVMCFIYFRLLSVESSLIPHFSVFFDYDKEKFWKDAADAIRHHSFLEDKLFHALRMQVEQRQTHLQNPDWIGKDSLN